MFNQITINDLGLNSRIDSNNASPVAEKEINSNKEYDRIYDDVHAYAMISASRIEESLSQTEQHLLQVAKTKIDATKLHEHIITELEKATAECISQTKELAKSKIDATINSENLEEAIKQIGKSLHDHIDYALKSQMVAIFENIAKQLAIEINGCFRDCSNYMKITIEQNQSKIAVFQEACDNANKANIILSDKLEQLIQSTEKAIEEKQKKQNSDSIILSYLLSKDENENTLDFQSALDSHHINKCFELVN